MARDVMLTPLRDSAAKVRPAAAFDTETARDNTQFVLGSISYGPEPGVWVDPEKFKFFYDPEDMLRALQSYSSRQYTFWATQLEFDFMAISGAINSNTLFPPGWEALHNGQKFMHFDYYYKGVCRTCNGEGCGRKSCDREECQKPPCRNVKNCICGEIKVKQVTLYDTLNIAPMGVAKMGDILTKFAQYSERKGWHDKATYFNVRKLEKPSFLGQKTLEELNERELAEYKEYNLVDSIVTRKFVEYMQYEFGKLGTQLRTTTPGIAMDLWRRQHLDIELKKPKRTMNVAARQSYFGGRTEVINFGYVEDVYAYDFKSMYPWAMRNTDLPHPNHLRYARNPGADILDMEGVTKATVEIPKDTYVPCLPYRCEPLEKVIFPVGEVTGTWTNLELRYALEQGVEIKELHWSNFSTEIIRPFDSFIDTLWNMRSEFLAEDNPANVITKLAMNSLYGKFGMNEDKDNVYEYCSLETEDALNLFDYTSAVNPNLPERGVLLRPVKADSEFAFVNLFWASYITSRARTYLHHYLMKTAQHGGKLLYMDTDSIYTDTPLPFTIPDEEGNLGDLCDKGFYKAAIFVAPKFYVLENTEEVAERKAAKKGGEAEAFRHEYYAKGLPPSARKPMRERIESGDLRFDYTKFLRFKEAAKRKGVVPNQIVATHKEFNPLQRPKRVLKEKVKGVDILARKQIDSRPWTIKEIAAMA